ncbi:MAG: hypothetical protein AUJ20_09155 [Comamonadaceae bacterium CG1_02_60_18]|nr:MAG: hypothetical protein AUJ20_09155 [Comamonadaceae bacterium CG1_02_60_18]PIQ53034.1 MAG: DNA polymerase subunit beta [Comamonadaceae bacterium CG12_big_fil_rev_8_21_14_0_65_59_15]
MPVAIESRRTARADQDTEFGLSARALALLRGLLARYPQIRLARIYGSRAKGNYREGSDIDIALDAPDMPFDTYLKLCGEIDDLLLPWDVDLTLLSHIDHPDLLKHIERVGQVLWQKPLMKS